MAHGLVDPSIGMGCVVAGVMDHRPFQMQRQKARAQQHRQGKAATNQPQMVRAARA